MNQLDELTELIAETRYPQTPDSFVPAKDIATVILEAGFVKKPIQVTRRMTHAALLKMFPGASTIQEVLSKDDSLERRMAEAIYAAWGVWKLEKE